MPPLEYALQYRGMFPDPGPWKLPDPFKTTLIGPLGIESLPHQRVRRFKLYPRRFNIMVVGESGLGKTTFINTLFNSSLNTADRELEVKTQKVVEIKSTTYQLCEGEIVLWLNVIDTPGFGDGLNRENDIDPIVRYIEEQYDNYMTTESGTKLKLEYEDTRVHLVLFFLKRAGSKILSQVDEAFLTRLMEKTNVLPLIPKADTLNKEETASLKRDLMHTFEEKNIKFFPFVNNEGVTTIDQFRKYFPFCVIGSENYIEIDGDRVRGRLYPWGFSEVENEEHCDFVHLRRFLFEYSMQEYTDVMKKVHYANYRASKIRSERPCSIIGEDMPYEEQMGIARKNMEDEIRQLEDEVKKTFIEKVRERETVLRESEERLIIKRKELVEELDALREKIKKERGILKNMTEKK